MASQQRPEVNDGSLASPSYNRPSDLHSHSGSECGPDSCSGTSFGAPSSAPCGEVGPAFDDEATPREVSKNKAPTTGKLSVRTKFFLGIGESVQGIYIIIGGYYLNSFLLETACIDAVYVGLMQGIQGAYDALNDPIIGMMSDRTRTRWGRRRPWLLFAAPPLAIFYFGLWNGLPASVPQFWKFCYAMFCYMGASAGITSIQVQIGALVPELTDDYDERTAVSAWRVTIMSIVGLVAVVIHNLVISFDPIGLKSPAQGYRISGCVFALTMWGASWLTFAGIQEKFQPKQESRKHMGFRDSIQTLFHNKAFFCVAGIYFCGPTAVCLVQSNLFMFCKYHLNDASVLAIIIPTVQGSGLLSMPLWVMMVRWFDKRIVYIIGGSGLVLSLGAIYFVQTREFAVVVSGFVGLFIATVYLVPYSMLPDVIEEDELRTGKRREGMYVGFFTIMLKVSVTVALTLTNWFLKLLGYETPVSSCGQSVDGSHTDIWTNQPGRVILCMRLLCSFIPVGFLVIAIGLAWCFPITRKKQAALAKLAAQARLERCKQDETSSIGSTHSPRDVKALTEFINDMNDMEDERVLNEMVTEYTHARYQEYRAQEYESRKVFFVDSVECPREAAERKNPDGHGKNETAVGNDSTSYSGTATTMITAAATSMKASSASDSVSMQSSEVALESTRVPPGSIPVASKTVSIEVRSDSNANDGISRRSYEI